MKNSLLGVGSIKHSKTPGQAKNDPQKYFDGALKHVQNAYFCILYVFLRASGHLAGQGPSGKRGVGGIG